MELEVIKWIAFTLMGVAIYFLKRTMDQNDRTFIDLRMSHVALTLEVQSIKNEYLHKNDFKEFKAELRGMFDEIKADIKGLREHSK